MGIKSLSKFLKEKYPHLFEAIHLSEYAYKRVAIDVSLYMYRYKRACWNTDVFGAYGWLGAFIRLVACLRENEIHCVFVYDSKAPKDKEEEQKQRAENYEKSRKKLYDIEEAIDKYHQSGEIDPILIELQSRYRIQKPILLKNIVQINIRAIEETAKKLRGQLTPITAEDFAITKKMFDILQVPYFQAPSESETFCSDLCIQGKVDAVLTEDTDVLCYGAPFFLTKIDTKLNTCLRIDYKKLLTEMNFTESQFLDFCIMCGTDYNLNIPRIGPAKAYSLITEHKSIEDVKTNTNYDTSILKHERVRELFRNYEKSECVINYCGIPDFNALEQLILSKRIRINVDDLRKSFIRQIVIEPNSENSIFDEEDKDEIVIEEDEEDIVIEIN